MEESLRHLMLRILFMGKLSSGLISIIFLSSFYSRLVVYYIPLNKQVPSCFLLRLNVFYVYSTQLNFFECSILHLNNVSGFIFTQTFLPIHI